MGIWLVIGFTEHLQNVATSNYSAIANANTLQFTTAHTQHYSVCCVFISRYLITASTISSASVLTFLSTGDCPTTVDSQLDSTPLHCTALTELNSVGRVIWSRSGPHKKLRFQQFIYCCVTQLPYGRRIEHRFPVSPLVRVRNLLPSNWRCLKSRYLATGIHATIWKFTEQMVGHPFQFSMVVKVISI
jgi:hypothetical protein